MLRQSWKAVTSVLFGLFLACGNQSDRGGTEESIGSVRQAISCATYPQWTVKTYAGGDRVQNRGNAYVCKPWPASGWCQQAAYEPGVTLYWADAWIPLGACGASTGGTTSDGAGGSDAGLDTADAPGGSGGTASDASGQVGGSAGTVAGGTSGGGGSATCPAPVPPPLPDPTCIDGACCPSTATQVVTLTQNPDSYSNTKAGVCIVALGGSDNLSSAAPGVTVVGGDGDDVIAAGQSPPPGTGTPRVRIYGGAGNDTIHGWFDGAEIFGGPGNDTIAAGPGPALIAPGSGLDTVSTGDGDDTFILYSECEATPGKNLNAGGGNDTLISPLSIADLRARGLTIEGFENVILRSDACKSDCVPKPICGAQQQCVDEGKVAVCRSIQGGSCQSCGDCAPGLICTSGACQDPCAANPHAPGCPIPPHCTNGVQDGNETGLDCGGDCHGCPPGGGCTGDTDCDTGLVCGNNNGACFGAARGENKCWKPSCGNGNECGQPGSACGSNCSCVTGCDSKNPQSQCPKGEVCIARMGNPLNAPTPDVCLDPRCPSSDPALCGTPRSLCGQPCICTPNCSSASCANPDDGCGGQCPAVCGGGQPGCTSDITCPNGQTCLKGADGINVCRPGICAFRVLVPPLCGSPGAQCGDTCPICTPRCDGRQCGEDPNCGQSCGTCGAGTICDADGECVPPTSDPPIVVTTPSGGTHTITDLPQPPPSTVGALRGAFSVTEQGTSQYTVPIDVPPGRAGIEPVLSLKYVGSRKNGDVGVGWHLDGLSKITRCPNTQSLDNQGGPIRNDKSDHFCVDGKRLEAVPSIATGTVGAYGGSGTEYRTLVDSFVRITSFQVGGSGLQLDPVPGITLVSRDQQGPDYFRALTKDGRILTFGANQDAIVMGRTGIRYAWLLTRAEDRFGNTMEFHYTNVTAAIPAILAQGLPNMVRPSFISYTGHNSELSNEPGNRRVRFAYETRSDPKVDFLQGGVPHTSFERMRRITTYLNDVPVKNYRLDYKDDDLSQISAISECAGGDDSHCKPPTKFDYVRESGFTPITPLNTDLTSFAQLDADGDGIQDFLGTKVSSDAVAANPWLEGAQIGSDIAVSVGSNFIPNPVGVAVSIVWSDLMSGIIFGSFEDRPQIHMQNSMYFGTGDRSAPSNKIDLQGAFTCFLNFRGPSVFFIDYDRDGKDDIMIGCPNVGIDQLGNPTTNLIDFSVAQSRNRGQFAGTGTILSVPFGVVRPISPTSPNALTLVALPRPVVYDVNGDSLQDVISCKDTATIELRLRPSPTQPFPIAATTSLTAVPPPVGTGKDPYCGASSATYRVMDVDGDGSPDLLIHADDGWKVLRFQAATATSPAKIVWQPVAFTDTGRSPSGDGLAVGDFNGDGLADIWNTRDDNAVIWLNSGDGRFWSRPLSRPRPLINAKSPMINTKTAVLDFNGDGRSDLFEQWILDSFAPQHIAQIPNNPLSALTPIPVHVQFINPFNLPQEDSFRMAADLDGDGNVDLLTPNGAFYGFGVKNRLLSHVVDGLGNVTAISYDTSGTYQTDARCQGSTWPEMCLKRMSGLVGSHQEGFVGSNGGDVLERTYTYQNINGRMNTTGQGWLGFDRRAITEKSGATPPKVVTIDYQPVARYDQQGNLLKGTLAQTTKPPYIYPLAGLAQVITTDQVGDPGQLIEQPPPLQSGFFSRRTRVENTWGLKLSASNRPFPFVSMRMTTTHDRAETQASPRPFDDNGTLLTECSDSFAPDSYGNVIIEEQRCQESSQASIERTVTTNTIIPDPANWFITNPKHVTVLSSRATTAVQDFEMTYEPFGGPNGTVVRSVVRGLNADDKRRVTTYDRDDFGNVQTVTEDVATGESARVTGITHDSDNIFPLTVTNAKGQTTQLRFDARWGTPKAIVDANQISLQRGYDDFGRLVEVVGPAGTTISTFAGSPISTLDTAAGHAEPRIEVTVERQGTNATPGGRVIEDYDNYGRVVRTTAQGFDADVVQEQTYDSRGRLHAATLPHTGASTQAANVVYSYDELNRLTQVTNSDKDKSAKRIEYATSASLAPSFRQWLNGVDCAGLPVSLCAVDFALTIDEEGRKNVAIYDHQGMVVRSVDGENVDSTQHSSNYRYGAFNRLIEARDNLGLVTSSTYDDYGRRTTQTDPDVGLTSYTYSGFDELLTSRDPKQQLRTYHHDELSRLDSIVDDAGAAQWIYDQGTNAIGRLTESISPPTPQNPTGQHVHYTYEDPTDTANRGLVRKIDSTVDGASYDISFEYDDLGRTLRVHYPVLATGVPIVAQYGYTPSGILKKLDEVGGPTPRPIWEIKDAFQGHLVGREDFGNGASSTYGYDPDRHWLDNQSTTVGASTLQQLEYKHFHNSRIQFRIDDVNQSQREHVYDNLNRLSSITDTLAGAGGQTTSYGYDPLGNITQRGTIGLNYLSDQPHLIDTAGPNTYHYDANGNVDRRSGPDVPGGFQSLEYTPFDLPSLIQTGSGAAARNTRFEYTADEMRAVRRDSDKTRRFVAGLYQQVVSAAGDTLEERFQLFVGSRQVGEIVRSNGTDRTLFFHSDILGTLGAISDNNRATFTQTFDPFGAPADTPNPAITRTGFTGQEHDFDLGLVDMKGRIYDPLVARFTTADPMMQAPFWSQGLNRYSYVFNDPINHTDPSGLAGEGPDVGGYIAAGYVGAGYAASAAIIAYGFGGNPFGMLGGLGGFGLDELGIGTPPVGQGSPGGTSTVSMSGAKAVPTTTGSSSASPNAQAQNRGSPPVTLPNIDLPPGSPKLACQTCALGPTDDMLDEVLIKDENIKKMVRANKDAIRRGQGETVLAMWTAAELINLIRGGWALVTGARAAADVAGTAAEAAVPTLAKGPGGKMLGEAVGYLRSIPGPQRVAAFEKLAAQITEATKGQWSARVFNATNATVFAGEGGEALVFDAAGNMFRGQLADQAAFAFTGGGKIEVIFSALRGL